jgi:predicted 3-demethylubiquinone-9 3-methyltransferase (glyoxalase superfamily)
MTTITPFLMFTGQAKKALSLYERCFSDFSIVQCDEYPEGEERMRGKIHYAVISIHGQQLAVIDSPVEHAFGFTPSLSLMVEFTDPAAIRQAYNKLTDGGEILMPLDRYDFAAQYAWINDPFGVSWQLKVV